MASDLKVPEKQAVPFRKYDSIENSYREKFIEAVVESAPEDEEWVAMEKIDGCNLSNIMIGTVHVDGSISISSTRASRNMTLGNDGFHNSREIIEEWGPALLKLVGMIDRPNNESVQIYGELYGGGYQGAKPRRKNSKKVMTAVQYSPDNEYRIFDILVGTGEDLLSADRVVELCRDSGIPYCPLEHRGKLSDLLKLNPVFQSTIPALHGLPPIQGNNAEGWVLKPVHARFIGEGCHRHRVIIKLKNPAFLEESKPQEKPKTHNTPAAVSKNAAAIEQAMLCINRNRLNSVRSKQPDWETGKLIVAMINDILEDVGKVHVLDRHSITAVNNAVRKEVALLVKGALTAESQVADA